MYECIESMLLDQQAALYLSIKRKSIEELNLPINVGNSIVGFGKILDFYMFWIGKKRGTVYFNARKEFTRTRANNSVKIEFVEENKAAIFDAIDQIYKNYLEANSNGKLQTEIQRVENKKSFGSTKAKYTEKSSAVELLWNNVTVVSLEKAENACIDVNDVALESVEQFKIYGQHFADLFDAILRIMENKYYPSISRKIAVYREYIEADNITLADIAPKYDVSRERIRQLVKRVDGHIFDYFKKMMMRDDEEFNECVQQLATVLESMDHNIPYLITYGLKEVSSRKKSAIFNMLFGKFFSQKFMEETQELIKYERKQTVICQKEKSLSDSWEFYRSKICYPSNFIANEDTPAHFYEKEKSFDFENRFYKKIKKFESIIEIVQNPDIIYYTTSQTDHRPNFLLRLPDKTSVLVLVLPTVNMAFIYNIQRCNELHFFCKEHGYGYLIMDDRGNSIYDIRNKTVDPELVARFDTILNNQTMIVWRNIKDIKLTRPVSNIDIAAYVLQNKLHFTMDPFCIKRRDRII